MSRRGSARGRRPSPAALLLPPAGSLRVFLVNFCLIFAALAVLGTGSLYYADKATRQRIAAQLRYEERIVVDAMLRRVRETLFTVTADLVYLRKRAERQVQSGQPVEALSDDWQDFAGSHRAYFQLRYLDAAGRERLRVQDGETGPILVAPEDLQDKSATSYMQAAALLRPPEILVTRLDANREFGRIQLPVQPVIRFLAPVMAADGSRAGSVAVNYRAALLLSSVQAIGAAGPGTPFLASDRGRAALADYTSGEAEAIARDGALQNQFAAAYPAAWAAMQDRESGSMADGAGGWVTYSRFTVSSLQPPAAFEDATRWRVASDLTGSEVPAGWFIGSRIDAATLERLLAPAESRTASVLSLFAGLLLALSWMIALRISALRAAAAGLRKRATRDFLTGLLNRAEFERQLDVALSHSQRFARPLGVLYLDLNDFKYVNDNLGHEAGDEVLKHVALVLENSTRGSDLVARLGGDEFAILLREIASPADARGVAAQLKTKLAAPLQLAGQEIIPGGSIGAATYPEDGSTAGELLREADAGMYREKKTTAAWEAARLRAGHQ